ncbi:hypothetical protein DCAR_0520197 [Daucus carota subsp. sativus]|uniref:3-oxo-5-alpha-steroid 4-dehydrogenase C-terminal domain-containing protein n=1 Tax=Daucus carota subsp. sativus TaxID=79200 RepID=A0AAF0X5J9_DAUCS|nr:PREDICTED: steroid 5-alpha-reductase DET2-like [Daucus carota subsp. sativus]WOH00822.1 hypothetical protein DCAR_0520197 [Daucus carota subsp. sativus]
MVMEMLNSIIYPPQPSLILTIISAIEVLVLCNAGFMETKGTHMQYSKFWSSSTTANGSDDRRISSRVGMLIFYTPALFAGVLGLILFPGESLRFYLVAASLVVHFLKRDIEVLFVHKFSGSSSLDHSIIIATSYFVITAGTIYGQYLSRGLPEPSTDLTFAGVAIFLIGITGNFYHHYILSNLRKEGEKQYKIPRGGLFGLVICPHYAFELLGFVGICLISQTIYPFLFLLGMSGYLVGRSYATKKWYISKFEDFPKDVKALIPFVF